MNRLIIVTGITIIVSLVRWNIVATAIAPNAICESPSPINENLLSTSTTPRSDEHRAISIPTINA
mgnify:CR=1 FL=1